MQIAPVPGLDRVAWYVDGTMAESTPGTAYSWPLQHGTHRVHAQIWVGTESHDTDEIRFHVN